MGRYRRATSGDCAMLRRMYQRADLWELIAALVSMTDFAAQVHYVSGNLIDAIERGTRPSQEEVAQMRERHESDTRELDRLVLRVDQLRAMQRLH